MEQHKYIKLICSFTEMVECLQMARETGVQSLVESNQIFDASFLYTQQYKVKIKSKMEEFR